MSNLLGAQLTIIGIVFPLVVGLISVLFQKNPRESIQTAYQLHSLYVCRTQWAITCCFYTDKWVILSAGDKYLDRHLRLRP
jgi:hypothetical protein